MLWSCLIGLAKRLKVMQPEHKPDSSEHGGAEWEKLKKDTEDAISRLKKLLVNNGR